MAILLLLPSLSAARDLAGRPRVLDGDTVVLEGTKVRLHDIDAPEREQWCLSPTSAWYPCGEHAARALSQAIGTGDIRCQSRGTDRYGRILGVCNTAGGLNLNSWLVRAGYAVSYNGHTGSYLWEEAEARAAGRGLWSGTFELPADFRRRKRDARHGP
ncbi:thermonuclease family protein [Asticcacaulis sp.]|uniref:thermonuclease family protein n=1 Tax=Asticcacaulis sp. TaxID=1872648 RepID=UPI002608E443|nr:thermonuclease family protein [Asticcacaulis sp.]